MANVNKILDANGVEHNIQAISVQEQNNNNALKSWVGTKAEYDAIEEKDENTAYDVTDDNDVTLTLLEALYPVGAIYIGTMATCPLQVLGIGTWQLKATDRVLQGAGTRGVVGATLSESLPNITGSFNKVTTWSEHPTTTGAITTSSFVEVGVSGGGSRLYLHSLDFNANSSSSVYQDNAPVQQDAYLVNIWERIS